MSRGGNADGEMWLLCMIFIYILIFKSDILVQTTLSHLLCDFFVQNWFSDAAVTFQTLPAGRYT